MALTAAAPEAQDVDSYRQKADSNDGGICVVMMALRMLLMAGDGAALPDFSGDATTTRAWVAASIIESRLLLP